MKFLAAFILAISGLSAAVAFSGHHWWAPPASTHSSTVNGGGFAAPEIDPASAVTALTLLLGGVTVLRSRTAKQ